MMAIPPDNRFWSMTAKIGQNDVTTEGGLATIAPGVPVETTAVGETTRTEVLYKSLPDIVKLPEWPQSSHQPKWWKRFDRSRKGRR